MKRLKKILLIVLIMMLCLPIITVNADDDVASPPTSKTGAEAVTCAMEDSLGSFGETISKKVVDALASKVVPTTNTETTYVSVDEFGNVTASTESYDIHINQEVSSFMTAYSGLSALTTGHMSFVGMLVTLIQYDNNLPEAQRETELGRVLFLNSMNALDGTSLSASMREVDNVASRAFYFTNRFGNSVSCEHNHDFPETVRDYAYDVSYGSASPDFLFGGFPKLIYPFDFSLGGRTNNFKVAIFNKGESEDTMGLVKTYFPKGDGLLKTFQLPDLNLVDYFETYFLKFEPVYRYFPAVLKEKDPSDLKTPFAGQSGNGEKVYTPTNAAGYNETTDEFDNAYPQSLFFCGDTVTEKWKTYPTTSPDTDGKCPSTHPNTDSSGNCYKVESHEKTRSCKIGYLHYFFSAEFSVPTGLLTPRIEASKGSYALLSSLYSSYTESTTKKEAVDIDGTVIEGKYDYIVGSTYKNAIANSPSGYSYHPFNSNYNKYMLIRFPNSSEYADWKTKVVGMALSSLMFDDDNCVDTCIKVEDPSEVTHSSDEYLKCAQSYCDSYITYNGYATNDKRDCIVKKCKYKPKTPIDCSNPTGDSLMLKDKALREKTGLADNSKSCCGFTVTNDFDPVGSKISTKEASIGAYSDCKRYGGVEKVLENGVSVYAYGTGNVDNSYINVLCEENSSFDFISLANKVIKPGTGFEYPIKLAGNRNCELFFDYVSWTYDFASTHSLDRVRKRMLLQKVEAFNLINNRGTKDNEINGSDLLGNIVYYDKNGPTVTLSKIEGDHPLLSSFNYSSDLNKVSVTATTEEYVNGLKNTKGYEFYNGGDPIVYDRTNIKQTSNLYLNNERTMTLYNKYKIGSNMETDKEVTEEGQLNVYSYKLVSSISSDYQLPKVCVDETNQGTVRLANNEGMCESFYGTKSGLRQYFTNFKYKNHDEYNRILAKTYVSKTDMDGNVIGGSSYIKVDDTCHYSYEPNLECNIVLDKKPACYISNSLVLENEDYVKAILTVDNLTTTDQKVKSQVIYAVKDGVVIASDKKSINVPLYSLNTVSESYSENLSSVNDIQIVGQVTINDGTSDIVKTCTSSVTPIKISNNGNCTITSVGGDKYKINIVGIENPVVYAGTGIQKDAAGDYSLVRIEPDNGNYYFTRLKKENEDVLMAKVEGSNGSAYCQLKFTCNTGFCCTDLYTPNQKREIKEYCENNYSIDCRRYDDPDKCFDHCSMSDCEKDLTEEERENLDKVEEYCEDHTSNDTAKGNCIALCYANYDTKATFRPINLNNPFPYSKYVGSSYNVGNRKVGVEWVAAYKTIAEDAAQIQRGQKVEYKIHLTASDIRAISADTKAINDSLTDGSIYQYTTNGLNISDHSECTSTGYTGFCSKFINASEFSSLFSHKAR